MRSERSLRGLLWFALAATLAGCASHAPDPYAAPGRGLSATSTVDAPWRNSIGWQRMAEGDPQAAQADFDQALQINPFDPVALNNVAVAKSENGQYYEAEALLERASKLAPENAEIAANLSRLRSYVNTYALQGSDPVAGTEGSAEPPQAAARGGLPPPPPPLWSAQVSVEPAPAEAGYYYDGCAQGRSRAATPTKKSGRRAATDEGCR